MSGRIFFISDTHFDHKRIIELCNRPFGSVEEMNSTIVANWNERVLPKDTVYFLGDFAFAKDKTRVSALLRMLNGTKHLIVGNHDREVVRKARGWNSVEIRRSLRINGISAPFVLDHYPIEIWDKRHYGAIHLFGHLHEKSCEKETELRHNVAVDLNGFAPIPMEEIIEMMERRAGITMDKEWGSKFQESALFDKTIPHFIKKEEVFYE